MSIGIIIIICLILFGVILMMVEIFLLPGITVAGIAGSILMIGSIVYAFRYMDNTTGYITIGANIIAFSAAFIFLIKSKSLDKIALKTDIDSTVDQSEINQLEIGQRGRTISRLNPIGKAQFGEIIVEVKSITGEFVDDEEIVEIVKIENSSVLVQHV